MTVPWEPENVITIEEASALILAQFPELTPIQIRLLGKGFDNTVFEVNQQYVFRFPRRNIAVGLLMTENQLLPKLAPSLNLPIPVPIFFGRTSEVYPWPFTGYRMVFGETPGVLNESVRTASARHLGKFMKELHKYPIELSKSFGVPYDQLNRLNINLRKGKLEENVNQAIKDGLINNAKKILNYLTNLQHVEEGDQCTLVHGDCHFRNILVDSNGLVSGIIDWGDVHIGHPAVDLSFAYSFLPSEGRGQFFEEYGPIAENSRYLAKFKAVYTSVLLLRYAHDLEDRRFVEAAKQSLALALSD